MAGNGARTPESNGIICGTRVSGSRVIEGRACVISERDVERNDALIKFKDGDIIVAPVINPSWLPYFSRAAGFVSEIGGWLSHTAILAREYNVPMIIGTARFADIPDNSVLRLHLDGQVEVLEEPDMMEIGKVAAE